MTPTRAWVLLKSGRRINLLDPQPDDWADTDLAIGLSRTYRWGGHSQWDLPLSVAQHSLLVLVLRQQMQPHPLTPGQALRELLHDASEGLLSFDPISPVKPHLGSDFEALDARLRAAIESRYRLPPWTAEDYRLHKGADRLAAASEALHVAGWSREEIRDALLILTEPLTTDPLPSPYGMRPWEPWPPRLAAALFLGKLRELCRAEVVCQAPADLSAVLEREATLGRLAAAFSRLPDHQRRTCQVPVTGNSLIDTFVHAEANDGSQAVEGVVVGGDRDADGQWDFEAPFRIFTTDGELLVCQGYNCHVDVQ
jgi:hypothetical protein